MDTESTPEEFTPEDALAVDATPDETRVHQDADETESALRNDGTLANVDPDDDGPDPSDTSRDNAPV